MSCYSLYPTRIPKDSKLVSMGEKTEILQFGILKKTTRFATFHEVKSR